MDAPEGVVYRYERDGSFAMAAMYVSNLNVGGDFMNDEATYNEWVDFGQNKTSKAIDKLKSLCYNY